MQVPFEIKKIVINTVNSLLKQARGPFLENPEKVSGLQSHLLLSDICILKTMQCIGTKLCLKRSFVHIENNFMQTRTAL